MLSFLPSVLILSFFVQQKVSSFLVFPSLTEKREKETPQHNQNGLWRHRTQKRERRGRQRGRKKASLCFSCCAGCRTGCQLLPGCQRAYPHEEESSIHTSFCWERPLSLALQGCDDFLACHVLQTLIRRKRRRKGDLAMGMPMGLWPQSLLVRMIRMDWVAHRSYQWTSFWVGCGDSPFLGPGSVLVWLLCREEDPADLWVPEGGHTPVSASGCEKAALGSQNSWPRAQAAHRLLSTGALPEPWATQASSKLFPNMDQASSGVSLACLCFMGTVSVSPQGLSKPRPMTLSSMAQAHRGLFPSNFFYVHADTHSYRITVALLSEKGSSWCGLWNIIKNHNSGVYY